MDRARVWITQPASAEVVARLAAHFDVVETGAVTQYDSAQFAVGLRDIDGVLASVIDRIDAAAIAQAQRLKAIANIGVGYNNLDVAALSDAGVVVTNTPDVLTETTADMAWALLLAAARRVSEGERWLRDGRWQAWSFDLLLGQDIHGSTLGILGMGRIGQAVARRARGFDMGVLYHNRSRLPETVEQDIGATYVDKNALLCASDHLVLVLPYSTTTHHAIGAGELALMKPGAILVNIARGGIVDDAALAAALQRRQIAAAGLDVFEDEPALNPRLLECRNIVLTPHIGSATAATRRAMAMLAADNLIAALGAGPQAGSPPNIVNAQLLRKA